MRHRHLDYPADTAPEDLPSPAIVDILDRGDLHDWLPLIRAVSRDPDGRLAERVAALVEAFPMYGTSPLWRAWLGRVRERAQPRPTATLSELRRRVGLTQAAVATRMGNSQSDISKLERRTELKASSLRDYLAALSLPLSSVTRAEGIEIEVTLRSGPDPDETARLDRTPP